LQQTFDLSYGNTGHDTPINKLSKALAECLALKHLDIAIVDLEVGHDVAETSKSLIPLCVCVITN
jgi:hypothetical protein